MPPGGVAVLGTRHDSSGAELRSFRDPAGHVVVRDDRVFRVMDPDSSALLRQFLDSKTARQHLDQGTLVATNFLEAEGNDIAPDSGEDQVVAEHQKVSFPSYPYEWAPEMLHAAAELTLDLASGSLNDGFGLKDGTPFNVLFQGSKPVFIDVLSFERRDPKDPTWLPHAQFVRTFLLPLLAAKHLGQGLAKTFLTSREGLEPEEIYEALPWRRRLWPPYLTLVSIPAWLTTRKTQQNNAIYQQQLLNNPEKAHFVLGTLFRGLRRSLRRAAPIGGGRSAWDNYMSTNSYSDADFSTKEGFCGQALEELQPRRVLDVGSNTGHFSRQAARSGASVVSIDYDPVVIGSLWMAAQAENLDIQPLVVNLAHPTPAMGWRNSECSSFLDRARGYPDLVLMLAVIHHLLVTERVPLAEIISLAAELTRDALVVEYVDPSDPMFQVITRGREELHRDLTPEVFEAACRERFDIVRSRSLGNGTRRIYLLRKRSNTG